VTGSRGQTILRGFLSGETFLVDAGNSHLQNLTVLQVAQSQAACPGDEDVEYRSTQAEATGLTREPANHRCSSTDFFE
jgi:hypothetical protein